VWSVVLWWTELPPELSWPEPLITLWEPEPVPLTVLPEWPLPEVVLAPVWLIATTPPPEIVAEPKAPVIVA
jgi:hypothetical protein